MSDLIRTYSDYEAARTAPDREGLLAVLHAFATAWPPVAEVLGLAEKHRNGQPKAPRSLERIGEAWVYTRERDAELERVLEHLRRVLVEPQVDHRGRGLELIQDLAERSAVVIDALMTRRAEAATEPPPDA